MKFRILISISLFLYFQSTFSQEQLRLDKADSLFKKEKYTEAFEIYQGIFNSGKMSGAMLSKMAFIKEGLGDYTSALFYLDKYYQMTGNKRALDKMAEIATSRNLIGYDQTDFTFFIHNFRRNQTFIVAGLSLLSLVLLFMIYRKKSEYNRPYASSVLLLLILAGIWASVNLPGNQKDAITKSTQTVLMEGPSAGANYLTTLGKGNKVRILNSDPVWTKVEMDGSPAYIRTNQLLIL